VLIEGGVEVSSSSSDITNDACLQTSMVSNDCGLQTIQLSLDCNGRCKSRVEKLQIKVTKMISP
jgi:hypothetical protein